MKETSYVEMLEIIKSFNKNFPRPNLILNLEELSPIKTNNQWQNAEEAGLYFLFDDSSLLQYIGKASFNSNIGARIGTRFSSKDCHCINEKFSSVTQLATIAFPKDRIFEISSCEEHFIGIVKPQLNEIGSK